MERVVGISREILHFMDAPHSDDLAEFLKPFDFVINGFGLWDSKRETPVVEGYICDYQIAYVAGGILQVSIQEKEYRCTKGAMVLFEPFQVYSTEILEGEEPFLCYTIHFDVCPEYRKLEFVQTLKGKGGNVYFPQELPIMEGMFRDLYDSRQSKEMGMILQTGVHLRLACLYMLRARWPKGAIAVSASKPNSARETEVVRQSIQYIQEHIENPLRIGDLSAALSISENYLYKCFVDVLETPPSRYILQYKIRLSVELMITTGQSLEEISEQLGFSSLYHFSKTFKQIMGSSPRQYVNSITEGKL